MMTEEQKKLAAASMANSGRLTDKDVKAYGEDPEKEDGLSKAVQRHAAAMALKKKLFGGKE